MDTIVKKTGASGKALEDMQGILENLTAEIPTDFQTAGAAIGEVNTRFGLTGDALEELSGQFIKFADLNDTDVSTSIDNVQSVLAAFGLSAEDASGMLDVLNSVGQATGIGMDQLASLMSTNAASLQEMGLNATQAAQFLGQVEMSGMDTTAAMTGLKTALKKAADDGITLDQAMQQWNATMQSGASDTEKLNASIDLFGAKAGSQFYNAAKQGTLSLDGLTASMSEFSGSVSNTFTEAQDPIDSFTTIMNQLKVIGADLVESAGPMIVDALKTVSGVVKDLKTAWDGLSPGMQEAIVKLALIAAAVGPVLSVGGRAITGIGKITSGIGGLVSKMSGATGGISGLVGKLTGLSSGASSAASSVSGTAGSLGSLGSSAGTAAGGVSSAASSFGHAGGTGTSACGNRRIPRSGRRCDKTHSRLLLSKWQRRVRELLRLLYFSQESA
jgi:phage-related minor tail protein